MPGWKAWRNRRRKRQAEMIPVANASYDASHGPARRLRLVDGQWVEAEPKTDAKPPWE